MSGWLHTHYSLQCGALNLLRMAELLELSPYGKFAEISIPKFAQKDTCIARGLL